MTGRNSQNIGKHIAPAHKSMARMLGYCLTDGASDFWAAFSMLAAIRLNERERAALAYSALRSLPTETATMTAAAVIGAGGAPLPTFLGGLDEARCWATFANRHDLKAYALAAFEAMTPKDQAAFFNHISELEVAP